MPKDRQPDFATIRIRYTPAEHCVELKSLKFHLWSYREVGSFHEAITNKIMDDPAAISPKRMVEGDFYVRGGIGTSSRSSTPEGAPKRRWPVTGPEGLLDPRQDLGVAPVRPKCRRAPRARGGRPVRPAPRRAGAAELEAELVLQTRLEVEQVEPLSASACARAATTGSKERNRSCIPGGCRSPGRRADRNQGASGLGA